MMLARADAGRSQLQCEPVSLDNLCRQMVDYILPLATQRDQTLTYEAAKRRQINGDLPHKQLLLNLLDNAIKYTDHHEAEYIGAQIDATRGKYRGPRHRPRYPERRCATHLRPLLPALSLNQRPQRLRIRSWPFNREVDRRFSRRKDSSSKRGR